MKLHLATDHAGYEMKEALKPWLVELGYDVIDHGASNLDVSDDYPDFIALAGRAISENPNDRAIVLGGSGQGEVIVANRFPHVRAAVFYGGSHEIVRLSREHNDANVLALGARFISLEEAKQAVELWLNTEFSGDERHERRLKKIDEIV